MPFKKRLIYLIAGFFPVGIIYFSTGSVEGGKWLVPDSFIEKLIPFNSIGIWLYLMFYVYIPYTYFTVAESKIKSLTFSFIVCACISGIIFIFFPTTITYPDGEMNGVSASMLNFVKQHDTAQNCFPSLHGSLITLCTIANFEKSKKTRTLICILITLIMYYSIIQVRRHVFIDLAAGAFLAGLVWLLCFQIFKDKRN